MTAMTIAKSGTHYAALIPLDAEFVALAERAANIAGATPEQAMLWAIGESVKFAKENALDPNWIDEEERAAEIRAVGN